MKTTQDIQTVSLDQGSERFSPGLPDSIDQDNKQAGINFWPLIRTMRRNALLIGGTTALAGGLAYWLSLVVPPTYQASFRLLVEAATPEATQTDPATVARGETRPRPTAADYATQMVILQSSKLLSDIADKVKVVYPQFTDNDLKNRLRIEQCCSGDALAGTPSTPTSILEVKYLDPDPVRAELVLEEAASRFLQYSLEERKSRIGEGVKFIDEQVPALQSRVASLQSQIQALQEQYLIANPEAQGELLSGQLADISDQKLETGSALREKITLYENLQRQLGMGPTQALASSTLSEDEGYQDILREREKVETEIALQSAMYNEASPVIQSLRDQQQELTQLQVERARQVLGPAFQTIDSSQMFSFQNSISTGLTGQMVDTINEISVLQSRGATLDQAANLIGQRLRQFPAISRQYAELERELDLAKSTLDQLLTQRETLKVEAAQSQFPWEVIATPAVPRDGKGNPIPRDNKMPRNVLLGLLAGLVAGTTAAVLREKSKDTFFSIADLEDSVPLPLLGTIPYSREMARAGSAFSPADGLSSSGFTNIFNNIYADLRLSPGASSLRSIAVGSPSPEDGKSTVAVNLARAAASLGQRVLLVDTNFQNPALHQLFGLPNKGGLSDILAGRVNLSQVMEVSKIGENLNVLPAGQSLAGGTKLLASSEMKDLAEQLQRDFDLVVYDTSSFEETSDVGFVASCASAILMVVGLRRTGKMATRQMVESIGSFQLPCVGFVTNYT
jgi:capsular exopolysaccharide synthesis family protein